MDETIQTRIQLAERVRADALRLVDCLGDRDKKGFSYWVDPGGKLQITIGNRIDQIEIALHGDSLQVVLLADSTGIQQFHPGAWVEYLDSLYSLARRDMDGVERHRQTRQQADLEARYSPMDDKDLFKED